jgi:metabotropic glutamate receptor 6/7/8
MGLRPAPTLAECETGNGKRKSGMNCRNPWFREFWSHHFRCQFPDEKNESLKQNQEEMRICTGQEVLMKYEQEGLVPFVGMSK